jgi:hypothetical protein
MPNPIKAGAMVFATMLAAALAHANSTSTTRTSQDVARLQVPGSGGLPGNGGSPGSGGIPIPGPSSGGMGGMSGAPPIGK